MPCTCPRTSSPHKRSTIAFSGPFSSGAAEWGFEKFGDLVNAALGEFIRRRRDEEWTRQMAGAATDPQYLRVLREISEDMAHVDAEGLGPEY